MNLIRNVAGTAFVVAEFRAEENLKENPLYRDFIVHVFSTTNRSGRRIAFLHPSRQ